MSFGRIYDGCVFLSEIDILYFLVIVSLALWIWIRDSCFSPFIVWISNIFLLGAKHLQSLRCFVVWQRCSGTLPFYIVLVRSFWTSRNCRSHMRCVYVFVLSGRSSFSLFSKWIFPPFLSGKCHPFSRNRFLCSMRLFFAELVLDYWQVL